MGNLTSQDPTMFWILKSVNFALKPSFWMMRAYLRLASLLSSSDLAPVTTILPEAKIRAVVFGSRIRMMTAANRCMHQLTRAFVELHKSAIYLWVVLGIASVQSNRL